MNVDSSAFKVMSLCSGGGGLDLGLALACENAVTVCYLEIEVYAAQVLAERMEEKALDEAPVFTDCRSFDGRPWRGKVDCITAGYPCQPFSVAGKRRGEEDPRHLWPEVRRLVCEVWPEWAYFENVTGHLRLGFDRVLCDLAEIGYNVEWTTLQAAEVGASHRRDRLFILAHTQELHGRPGGQRIKGQKGLGRWRPAGKGTELANRDKSGREMFGGGLPENPNPSRGHDPDGCCCEEGELADTQNGRLSSGSSEGNKQVTPEDGKCELGNTNVKGSQAWCEPQRESPHQLPAWPPGPQDKDAWAEIISQWPGLAPALDDSRGRAMRVNSNDLRPADRKINKTSDPGERQHGKKKTQPVIRGMAHGLANRVDRLRMLGNGVVPVQAALAFIHLYNRAIRAIKN